MKHLILNISAFLIGGNLLFSCTQDEVSLPSSLSVGEAVQNSTFQIPVDSALANLYDFMAAADVPGSRSSETRKVSEVSIVRTAKVLSRSNYNNVDCENLLYIANFENEQGYAILAADKRISEKVLAITDQGSLNSDELNSNCNYQTEESERPFFKDYPADGPAFTRFLSMVTNYL